MASARLETIFCFFAILEVEILSNIWENMSQNIWRASLDQLTGGRRGSDQRQTGAQTGGWERPPDPPSTRDNTPPRLGLVKVEVFNRLNKKTTQSMRWLDWTLKSSGSYGPSWLQPSPLRAVCLNCSRKKHHCHFNLRCFNLTLLPQPRIHRDSVKCQFTFLFGVIFQNVL